MQVERKEVEKSLYEFEHGDVVEILDTTYPYLAGIPLLVGFFGEGFLIPASPGRTVLVDLDDGEIMRLSSNTKARRLKISAVVND